MSDETAVAEDPAVVDYFNVDGHETEALLEFWAGETERDSLDAAMHYIWCSGHWRHVTANMRNDWRDAAADAVLRYNASLTDHRDAQLDARDVRWWRNG